MTKNECIKAIKKVNMGNYPITVYRDLCRILQEYNEDLYCELTDRYVEGDTVVANIQQMDNLEDILNAVDLIENASGVYYECGLREYEEADLEQFKQDILNELENFADTDTVNNNN